MNPVARKDNVIVQQVGADLVVYDELTDCAHSLNPVAAHVFSHADGTRDLAALAAAANKDLGVPDDLTIVEEALANLGSVELLASGTPAPERSIPRREALKRLGIAAVALPVVTSLVAPSPLLARSRGGARGPKGPKPKKPRRKP